jgi:hypothetical protein
MNDVPGTMAYGMMGYKKNICKLHTVPVPAHGKLQHVLPNMLEHLDLGQKKLPVPEKLFGVKEDLGAGFSFSSFFSSFFSFSFSFLSLLSGTSFFQDLIKLFAIVIISSSLLAFLSGTKTNNVKLPQIC